MTPAKRFPRPHDLLDRWLLRVEKDGHGGCWRWTGKAYPRGYGAFYLGGGRYMSAHRWGYQRLVEPVPDHLDMDHLCRNRWCVNPDHLEPVTHTENIRRGEAAEANILRNQRRTHCVHGHELSSENTTLRYSRGNPYRQCVICERAGSRKRSANYYKRRKAANAK